MCVQARASMCWTCIFPQCWSKLHTKIHLFDRAIILSCIWCTSRIFPLQFDKCLPVCLRNLVLSLKELIRDILVMFSCYGQHPPFYVHFQWGLFLTCSWIGKRVAFLEICISMDGFVWCRDVGEGGMASWCYVADVLSCYTIKTWRIIWRMVG